jgi:hypothetical protein
MSSFSNFNNFLIGISELVLSTNSTFQFSFVVTISNYFKLIPKANGYFEISI